MQEDTLVVATEMAGRQIIGYVTDLETAPIVVYDPLVLVEQHVGNGRVNIAIVPVLVSMVVAEIIVNPSSLIVVPPDSKLAGQYTAELERINIQIRAANAGIITSTEMPGKNPHNGGPITQIR